MTLSEFFSQHPKTALAFSGGTDSAYLLWAALDLKAQVRPYYVKSAFQPDFELEDAKRLCRTLNTPLTLVPLDILSFPEIASNPENRCYYCKREIFSAIARQAAADGFHTIIDGTNASDDPSCRPGMKALSELSVLSPLRECGIGKDEIRTLSRKAGLFTWDKAAYSCLATRAAPGQALTEEKLLATQAAEDFLFSLGFRNFRVRSIGETARLELQSGQLALLMENRELILRRLKEYYDVVLLNLEVRDGK